MTKLEKDFKELILDNGLNIYQYKDFIKHHPNIYKAITQVLHNISVRQVEVKGLMMLDKKDVKKLKLDEKTPRLFYYCGCFLRENKKVVLLESVNGIGTFYFENSNIANKLKDYKLGLKVKLELVNEKIDMVIPFVENNNIGLFEELG